MNVELLGSQSILIVDDDPIAIQLIRRALPKYRDIRFATSGDDAHRLIRERIPDLILLDAEMPGETGLQFCRRLKSDPEFEPITVIFVTAHDSLEFEAQAIEAGAADFVAKPISSLRVRLRVDLHARLKVQLDQLRALSNTDGLTRLANRRAIDTTLARELSRARRTGSNLSFVLIDVDHFKLYNESYGHPAGDSCLQMLAETLESVGQRPVDLVGRFGGEEFALILPDTDAAGALHVANAVRALVSGSNIPHGASPVGPKVTVSVGVSSFNFGSPPHSQRAVVVRPEDLVSAADQALSRAKELGRDRVEFLPFAETLTSSVYA